MLPDKIGAVIIRDKRLLLVSDEATPFFWMPGGKLEHGEDHHACLARELREELGCSLVHAAFFVTKRFMHEKANDWQTIHYYLVEIIGIPKPSAEITRIRWCAREELTAGEVLMTKVCGEQLLPMLLEQNLL